MAVKEEIIEIKSAVFLKEYRLKLIFNDGKSKTVDFGNFLKNSRNPMTKKFLKKSNFQDYKIKYGDLVWGDYEMCFPIWDLYEGKIS